MANDVRITVSVNDNASAALRKVGQEADRLGTSAAGTANGVSSLSSSVGKLSAFAGGFVVASALTQLPNLLMSVTGAASDMAESTSKATVVFGNQSSAIMDWGSSAATAMGMSSQSAIEAAGTFGNLFVAMNIGQEPAAAMSKNLIALAADLASFNNMPVDEALIKLRAGLVGETEPLRTLGVNLTAADVSARAMSMGLADATGQVSAAAKAQASYALIFEQTKTAQGDYARTSDGLANSQKTLGAQFADLKVKIGEGLIVPMGAAVSAASDLVAGIGKLIDIAKKPILVQIGFSSSGMPGQQKGIADLSFSDILGSMGALTKGRRGEGFGGIGPAALQSDLTKALDLIAKDKIAQNTMFPGEGFSISAGSFDSANSGVDFEKLRKFLEQSGFGGLNREPTPEPGIVAKLLGFSSPSISSGGANAAPPAYVTALQDQIRAAYVQGGMKQVEVVRRSQADMMAAVDTAAAQMSIDLGINLPDATQLMFDKMLKQQTDLAAAQEAIANANMLAQIDAYLKGGQAAVDVVKLQQADTAVEISKMANGISKTFGILMPEALGIATKAAGATASAMLEMGKQAASLAAQLFKTVGNTAQQGAMVGLAGAVTGGNQASIDAAVEALNALSRARNPEIPKSQGGAGPERMASGGIVRARPGGTLALLGEGGRDEAVIPLGGAGGMGGTVNVYLSGVITDPVATGRAVAAALNTASRTTGPLLLAGTVQ